ELHIRRKFGVLIQAIRREGKYIRFPDGNSDLQSGDRLLLCGNFHALNQARLYISPSLEPTVSDPGLLDSDLLDSDLLEPELMDSNRLSIPFQALEESAALEPVEVLSSELSHD
ncbi:MAG TPA: TrkA C-terminal domain-containing protein, partial [Chroococcidiopsis sp.]